jgi:3'(2'), 5'-bisphosphate nucleotidase
MSELEKLIPSLISICLEAGEKIMNIYNDQSSWNIEVKDDKSPLTKADKEANKIIEKGLKTLPLTFPIISEEGKNIPYETRKDWTQFWLVDPLDGTKEFIKRNGQFTVNIALIEQHVPILGIIYAPATQELFYGLKGKGAFKLNKEGKAENISISHRSENWISVGSSSHANEEEANYLSHYPIVESIKSGSSLKFCKVAEGLADIYLRTGPTMEWDTAAGQCIAESAGALMTKLDGSPFVYNKQSLLNTGFVCKKKN